MMSFLTWVYMYPCYCFYVMFVLCALFSLTYKLLRMLNNKSLNNNIPPGSRGIPFFGETLQFMAAANSAKGFYEFVRIRHLRYGKCFKTKIFGETQAFVSSTESAKIIFSSEPTKFTKRYLKSIAELVGDHSLLCASYQHHKLLRSHLAYLFTTSSISFFIKHFDRLILKTLDAWKHDSIVIVLEETLKMTFKIMCKILMSLENEEELEVLQKDISIVCEAMLAFPLKFPWTRFYKGVKARKRIMSRLEKIINERRKGPTTNHEDFLQHILFDEPNSLTDAEIQDNILTMIIAGQDTTASVMTWMIKFLGENRMVLDVLRAEQLNLAENISDRSFLTLEDLNEMPYASKVVKESLRIASVVAWFPRLVLEDCEIEGHMIRKGWNVNIDAKSIHLDSTIYTDPEVFNPLRFNEESKPYSFLAFGMGVRTCLGMNMAKAIMLVFLHRIVTTYEWKVMDSDSSIAKWALFARLKSGCPVHITRINPGG
ncbi:hypothetical protein ACFE04_012413 [Oxalis oulophora]